MSFHIISFDEDDEPVARSALAADTPWAEVQEAARQASLQEDVAVVIVTNDGADELWRYPEGYDA